MAHLVCCEVELLQESIIGVHDTDGVGYWVGVTRIGWTHYKQLCEGSLVPLEEVIQSKLGASKESHLRGVYVGSMYANSQFHLVQ